MRYCQDCFSCKTPCGREHGHNGWSTYYLGIAEAVSIRSKDPVTKVGCVIVGPDNRIIATGYNGTPSGFPESSELWESDEKHDYVVHAEMNALLHCLQYTIGCVLYTTMFPCKDCAKAICSAGISKVIYRDSKYMNEISVKLFKSCGIVLEQERVCQ
jgi:deoxycytidylate deaminase